MVYKVAGRWKVVPEMPEPARGPNERRKEAGWSYGGDTPEEIGTCLSCPLGVCSPKQGPPGCPGN